MAIPRNRCRSMCDRCRAALCCRGFVQAGKKNPTCQPHQGALLAPRTLCRVTAQKRSRAGRKPESPRQASPLAPRAATRSRTLHLDSATTSAPRVTTAHRALTAVNVVTGLTVPLAETVPRTATALPLGTLVPHETIVPLAPTAVIVSTAQLVVTVRSVQPTVRRIAFVRRSRIATPTTTMLRANSATIA